MQSSDWSTNMRVFSSSGGEIIKLLVLHKSDQLVSWAVQGRAGLRVELSAVYIHSKETFSASVNVKKRKFRFIIASNLK